MSFEAAYILIGFLGLVSSMIVLLVSYTERKFFQFVAEVYTKWREELSNLNLGVEEYERRIKALDEIIPDFRSIRRKLTLITTAMVMGLLIYSYALLATIKGWRSSDMLLKLFVTSAFFFIFSGFYGYFMNRMLAGCINEIILFFKGVVRNEEDCS